jgi:DNA-binding winged helix-turn-helix (wHTH) protein/Tol biopolymer transport system component
MAFKIREDSPSPSPRPRRIAFDNFEVDLRSGEVRKNGSRIRLQAQPFQLLVLLLENAGDVVSREEICRELWPADTFVDFEHSLAAAVNKIREALGDAADNPRYIETLPKRGYRFIGKIKLNPPVEIKVTEQQRSQGVSESRPALEAITPAAAVPARSTAAHRRKSWLALGAIALALILLAAGTVAWLRAKRSPAPAASRETSIQTASQNSLIQLTDFADSAVSPALSPDGRILAFIRGPDTFIGTGQIYAKLLPNSQPVQLTHDSLAKMSPQFSSNGSIIFYTVFDLSGFNTWTIPVLGGEPRLLFPNTEGLTWIDSGHFLFSEFVSGIHMGVVTSTSTREQVRQIYLPPRERGMAHRSALSPDRKWLLVVEMDNGGWLPCRLVPFDASSSSKPVGPPGAACTYVAWSPDQAWMYFSSSAGGRFHIWRQRFPDGEPQQLTSGATEEEGIAVTPDGSSLITSVGLTQSTLWVRDAKDERQISSEGFAEFPNFSRDGNKLYYLVHRKDVSGQSSSRELWVADLETGHSARLLPDTLVSDYDVSPDGTQVVFSAADSENRLHLWLASLNSDFPPRQFISPVNEDQPRWDSTGYIYFRAAEGKLNFLYRMRPDGSQRVKLLPNPILDFQGLFSNGRWAIVAQPESDGLAGRIMAIPFDGGTPVTVCPGYCVAYWTSDEKSFSVILNTSVGMETLVAPVSPSKNLPSLPPSGISSIADMRGISGAKVLDGAILEGPKPGLSASLHQDVHRNLYRVALQ